MFAEHWVQNKKIKKIFYQVIEEKIKRDEENMLNGIDENLPKMFAIPEKFIAKTQFAINEADKESRGKRGENSISRTLRLWLPRNYRYFDDVVLEPKKDQFIQLDHIIIAPQGIFIVETKTWKGVIFASSSGFRLKTGKRRWVEIENPIKQNERHVKLFKIWLSNNFPDKTYLKDIVYPVVVLKETNWFRVKEALKMPVLLGGLRLVSFIKSINGNKINNTLSKEICEKIAFAEPYERKTKITFKECINKFGKKYVRVTGTLKNAQELCRIYKAKGYKITIIRRDKRDKNVFYFYID